jgi:two-component system nitrogen regulation response regulator NtrX
LDEIGDMSLKAQSKTLRILQEQKFERVGGTRTIKVDVRVIAATNKDLVREIEKGRFREDLFFRLNVIPMRVPPLRERVEDIPELVDEFIKELSLITNTDRKHMTADAMTILQKYEWPGNVRELKNLIERLIIMTPGSVIQAKDVPAPFNRSFQMGESLDSAMILDTLREAKAEFEKTFIKNKLRQYGWNISQTAEAIGIERSNLHKKIKAYDLEDLKS